MNYRSEINRANAQHSTGPVTAASKETSSRNALTHGLTSKKLTLNPEERVQFDKLLASYTATYKPVTEAEKTQLSYMTEHFWRLERALKVEQILFDRAYRKALAKLEKLIAARVKEEKSAQISQAIETGIARRSGEPRTIDPAANENQRQVATGTTT